MLNCMPLTLEAHRLGWLGLGFRLGLNIIVSQSEEEWDIHSLDSAQWQNSTSGYFRLFSASEEAASSRQLGWVLPIKLSIMWSSFNKSCYAHDIEVSFINKEAKTLGNYASQFANLNSAIANIIAKVNVLVFYLASKNQPSWHTITLVLIEPLPN